MFKLVNIAMAVGLAFAATGAAAQNVKSAEANEPAQLTEETTGQGQGVRDSGGEAKVEPAKPTGQSQGAAAQSAQDEETTGQGQGVKESGGQAGVKTPEKTGQRPGDKQSANETPESGAQTAQVEDSEE